jgi:hypothetical protein
MVDAIQNAIERDRAGRQLRAKLAALRAHYVAYSPRT